MSQEGYRTDRSGHAKTTALAEPLRVLMVCARYLPDVGGTETHVYEVARRLAQRDDLDVTVLATDRTRKLPRREVLNGVKVIRVPAWPSSRDYYLAPEVARVIGQRSRWDLVHFQGIHTLVPILGMLAARRAAIPYVVTFHTGGTSLRYRRLMRSLQWRLIGLLLRKASSLIAVSRYEADMLSNQAGLGDKRIVLIRNGGTLPPLSVETAVVPGRIISTGRLERYKGHHRVIEALPHVQRDIPEAHVLILGIGSYEGKLRELARRLGVVDRVIITYLPPEEREAMSKALAESSVVAALSEYEAHPVAVMEALSAGRPVVGYDVAGISELVSTGWVQGITPGAPATTVAHTLVRAMCTPSIADPANLPTWDCCADQLMQVYLTSAGFSIRPAQLLGHTSRNG